jgi:hypothetical protein
MGVVYELGVHTKRRAVSIIDSVAPWGKPTTTLFGYDPSTGRFFLNWEQTRGKRAYQEFADLAEYHQFVASHGGALEPVPLHVITGPVLGPLAGDGPAAGAAGARVPLATPPRSATRSDPTPLPTAAERPLIDEYVQQLQISRDETADAATRAQATARLNEIEAVANREYGQGDLAHLVTHIYMISDLRDGVRTHPVQEGNQYHNGLGRRVACQAAAIGPIEGLSFAELDARLVAAGATRQPLDQAVYKPGDRARITWIFTGDKSMVVVDLPGRDAKKEFQINREVHAAKIGPDKVLHLSDAGVGVPFDSTPAHIRIYEDDTLRALVPSWRRPDDLPQLPET